MNPDFSSSFPSSKQSKVMMQRQYREKEGECFFLLRDVIRELTGDELQTRQEILKKVIEMLLSLSEIRKQTAEIIPPAGMDEDPSPSDFAEMGVLALRSCHSTPSISNPPCYFPYTSQFNNEFNLENTPSHWIVGHVPTQFHDQPERHHSSLMPDMNLQDFTVDPNGYQECLDGFCIQHLFHPSPN